MDTTRPRSKKSTKKKYVMVEYEFVEHISHALATVLQYYSCRYKAEHGRYPDISKEESLILQATKYMQDYDAMAAHDIGGE